jgi:guanylate kinase
MDTISSQGILVLSAPSGGGKTSLARALVAQRDDVEITVSHTTRGQRPGEQDGVHYYFVDRPGFEAMIEDGAFIEYATVFGNYYGTSVEAIETLILDGKHAILDIDWQGARNVRKRYPAAVSVFVMPPSVAALEQRLRQRRQDSEDVIERRMQEAATEMSHRDEFDVIIINDDFDNALAQLGQVLDDLGCAAHVEQKD